MTKRVEGTTTFTQAFDINNRLTAITRTGGFTLTQVYDADGVRVRRSEGPTPGSGQASTTTLCIGAAVEVMIRGATRVTTTYYFFGGQRVAMRQGATAAGTPLSPGRR